jgi:hypothetical protein
MSIVLLVLLFAVAMRYLLPEEHRQLVRKATGYGIVVGAAGFVLGFFGPMILAPEANQGPMLGIFITGPLGFGIGLVWGVVRNWSRRTDDEPI